MIGPITLWANEDTDEEPEQYLDALQKHGATSDQLKIAAEFLDTNPLYQVTFEFYLDEAGAEHYCTKVDLGDGKPFTRSHPGEQLTLFDQDAQ